MRRLSSFRRPFYLPPGANLAAAATFVALGCAITPAGLCAAEEQTTATAISRQVRGVFEQAAKAVVKVHATDSHGELWGTGFFVDPTGTLYTSYTVGGDADNFSVEFKGQSYPARQVVADIRSGLAMLKVDLVTPTLPIGKSREMEVATPVVAIGYPLDLPETPSFGMIAGFDHKYLGQYFSTTHLRVNLPAQRGESGAPLLNLKGEVVGIVVSSLDNGSACYAVPIEVAEKIRSDFVRFGEVRHGWIGATVTRMGNAVDGSRAKITEILATTPATDSGLRPGDILLQVGKIKVHEPEDVLDASFFLTAGDTVPVTVVRNGQKLTFDIQAAVHPDARRQRLPLLAAPPLTNQAMPLSLQARPR
jgi:S1-C subfamily serine protease